MYIASSIVSLNFQKKVEDNDFINDENQEVNDENKRSQSIRYGSFTWTILVC